MLNALLALLGVDLIVLVVLLAFVLSRKRWVMRQPGAFRGTIRVASGEIDGLRPKWCRYGRWVGDVFVWTKAPLPFRNELVAIDGLDEQRPARPDEIKRRLRTSTRSTSFASMTAGSIPPWPWSRDNLTRMRQLGPER